MEIIIDWKRKKAVSLYHFKNINFEDYYEFFLDSGFCYGSLYPDFKMEDIRVYDKEKYEILLKLVNEKEDMINHYNNRIERLKNTFDKITIDNFKKYTKDLEIKKCY